MRESFDVVKHDDHALMIRQLSERAFEVDRGRGTVFGHGNEVIEQLRLDVRRSRESRVRGPDADRREPRRELRTACEAMDAATAGEPRLLHDVVDFLASSWAEKPHDDHAKPRRVAGVQLAKRPFVSSKEAADQCNVSELEKSKARHTI
jgi:hypothetical protein